MKKYIYPQIVYYAENDYYHSKIYKISKDVISQWCKQNNFSVITCREQRIYFGKCKKGYAVLFRMYSKSYPYVYYIMHFTRHINDEFMEMVIK